jgi:hypothetical protein
MQIIPAWLVALIIFAAAIALWSVRPMPRMVRISLIAPLLYISFLNSFIHFSDLEISTRTDLARLGTVLLALSILINAVAVRIMWSKRRWL